MNPPYEFNLRQEADYVLGMMDLYENDGEITGILRTKGLTNQQVAQRSVTSPFFYALLYGIGQSVYGTIRFFTYSKKIRNIS